MSIPSKDIEKILGNDVESIEINHKKKEIEIDNVRTRHSQLQDKKSQLEAIRNFNLGGDNSEFIKTVVQETEEYLLKAKNAKVFLNDDFRGKVPFFPRNVILAAAETGVGKSTICSNLATRAMLQKQRILILTNEENVGDVYNRITCNIMGWAYVDHGSFTDEQRKKFSEMTPLLAQRIEVVGNSRNGLTGLTTTIEGVEQVLNSIVKNDNKFDLIMVDYYQNIDKSTEFPHLSDWQVQYRFCKFIDQYKNISPATIVILAQLKSSKDKELPFKEAIEGRKTILNISTCAMRVTKDAEEKRTGFEIVKSRFTEGLGTTTYVGFNKGQYVPYTAEFRNEVEMSKLAKATQAVVGKQKLTNFNNEG